MSKERTVEVSKGKNLPIRIEVIRDKSGRVIRQRAVQIPKHRQIHD